MISRFSSLFHHHQLQQVSPSPLTLSVALYSLEYTILRPAQQQQEAAMTLHCKETSELITQVQQLVARLMDQDQNVKETFDDLECGINRYHVAIDCNKTQV